MLGHIMNLSTIMKENPEFLLDRIENPEEIINPDQYLFDRIENHPNPMHPTDAFQYIVGEFISSFYIKLTELQNFDLNRVGFCLLN